MQEIIMSTELFFIYDSHCPWSYVTTALVKEIMIAYPETKLNLLHCAHYEGDEVVSNETLKAVEEDTERTFPKAYVDTLVTPRDSTMSANLLCWLSQKIPQQTLPVLTALQALHFEQGISFTQESDFESLLSEFKLSPPAKIFKKDKYTKEAEFTFQEVSELQDFIGTKSFPALLLAHDENLILLNHSLYLQQPKAIVEAVAAEINI
jgi:protein-disulfide isomerase-like protein with CxxC motif